MEEGSSPRSRLSWQHLDENDSHGENSSVQESVESRRVCLKTVKPSSRWIPTCHQVLMGCLVVSVYAGMMGQWALMGQYIYHRYAVDANIPGRGLNQNGSMCDIVAINDTLHFNIRKVQQQSSRLNTYQSLATGLPSLITVLLCGIYSDRIGRKMNILIPWTGTLIYNIILTLVLFLEWPLWVTIIAFTFKGLGGGDGAMVSGILAMLADTTTKGERKYALTIFEFILYLSTVASQLLVGWWIKLDGSMKAPFVFTSALLSSCALYLICLPETAPSRKKLPPSNTPSLHSNTPSLHSNAASSPSSSSMGSSVHSNSGPLAVLKDGLQTFRLDKDRGCLLFLALAAYFLHLFLYIGHKTVAPIYLLSAPFCWDSVNIGYFNAGFSAAINIGLVLTVFLLHSCLRDVTLIIMGFLSFSGYFLAWTGAYYLPKYADFALLFTSVLIGIFTGLCVPMIRTVLSKLVSPTEQGTLFASMASMETLGIMLGTSSLNSLYELTLGFMAPFVFLFCSVLSLLAAILMIIFRYKLNRYMAQDRRLLIPSS